MICFAEQPPAASISPESPGTAGTGSTADASDAAADSVRTVAPVATVTASIPGTAPARIKMSANPDKTVSLGPSQPLLSPYGRVHQVVRFESRWNHLLSVLSAAGASLTDRDLAASSPAVHGPRASR